jgi:hypothetical protein
MPVAAHGFNRLTQLIRELEDVGFDCDGLSYHRLWRGAVEGHFPAWRIGNVWHTNPDDLGAIAQALNLSPREPRAGNPSRRAAPANPADAVV